MNGNTKKLLQKIKPLLSELSKLPQDEKIELSNEIKKELHHHSPFKNEPVDCVLWVKTEKIYANDYNPNAVAPPEMKLLEQSVSQDGYTQPIVAWPQDSQNQGVDYEVVDGFHRNRVGRECESVIERTGGYLPLTIINPDREGRGDRIAATIRHNRARGKHQIDGMAEIVIELKRRNWSEKKIGKELGMDPDEVLRLCQITGLAEMFEDCEFTQAWEADTSIINEDDNIGIEGEN